MSDEIMELFLSSIKLFKEDPSQIMPALEELASQSVVDSGLDNSGPLNGYPPRYYNTMSRYHSVQAAVHYLTPDKRRSDMHLGAAVQSKKLAEHYSKVNEPVSQSNIE